MRVHTMLTASPNMKWASFRLLCLVTCIYELATSRAALGDVEHVEDPAADGSFRQLAIAWVSDIHLQPHYSMLAHPKERCGRRRGEPTDSPESPGGIYLEVETGPELGRAGCGSSRILFDETLNFLNGLVIQSRAAAAAGNPTTSPTASSAPKTAFTHYPLPPINTILLTGDFAHARKDVDPNYLEDALKEFTSGLFERFPQNSKSIRQGHSGASASEGIQLVLVVGNHDFPPAALLPPQRTRAEASSEKVKGRLTLVQLFVITTSICALQDACALQTFLRGMYYSTDLREEPKMRVICLNTNFYAVKLRKAAIALIQSNKHELAGEETATSLPAAGEDAAEEADPAGQFEWLEEELRSARARGQQVIICGHVMPGLTVRLNEFAYFRDNWESAYTARYRDLISAYSDVVAAQLYGHQHEGTMVVLPPRGTQAWKDAPTAGPRCNPRQPNLPTALLTIPSISPQNGNNPTMRVLVFDGVQDNHQQPQEYEERERAGAGAYALADYAQYHLPLYGFVGHSGFGRTGPAFEFESSFQDIFRPFMRCAKPSQLSLASAAKGRKCSGPTRCIDGSTALQVADALERSPFAYAEYMKHRYAGGKDVASKAASCGSLAVTEEDFIECIYQMK
ncbi:uncharacterized protein EMH_0007460 [Eimeria mitis]|uniref:Uncharacterized protein n=1 Tax=Eimeria mitis TaxID=44415 RepID=U6JMU3_9EIME|nr:uncharacterized protein EMH_0007460 [Eimeria mitis]CDJ26855.1 hypothetical protein EMH_0007460 [Eimeria mitis]